MIGRRNTPDGMPFRLYRTDGKFKTTFWYQLPNGSRAFSISAKSNDPDAVNTAKLEAVRKADELNGNAPVKNSVEMMIKRYFDWQDGLKPKDARKKAPDTLKENKAEAKNLIKVFGRAKPTEVKPKHIYGYLSARADGGAPAKANKEVALLSAIFEYGRMRGELEVNPCRGIKKNPTNKNSKLVKTADLDLAIDEARKRGGSYLVLGLAYLTAFLTTSRPSEMRSLTRKAITDEGLLIPVSKRRGDQASKSKLIQWSPKLKATIDEAISLQRTPGLLIFSNTSGQKYSVSGWTTIWNRLMGYCEARAESGGISFERFALRDMRPKSITERKERGEANITDATGHSDEKMINLTYDRRAIRKVKSTE